MKRSVCVILAVAASVGTTAPVMAQQGSVGGACFGNRAAQAGSSAVQSGVTIVRQPVKVTLVRIVDSEGKVEYLQCKDAQAVERRQKELTAQYERAYSQWVKAGKKEAQEPKEPTVNKVSEALAKYEAQRICQTPRTAKAAQPPARGS